MYPTYVPFIILHIPIVSGFTVINSSNFFVPEENKVQMTAEDFWALCVTGLFWTNHAGPEGWGTPKIAKSPY